WFPLHESTASRESVWTCRSALAELGNACGVYHMAHTGLLRRRRRPSTSQSRSSDRKTAGVYHDHHPDTAADAGLRGLLLSRLNRIRWPTFIPAFTVGVWRSRSLTHLPIASIDWRCWSRHSDSVCLKHRSESDGGGPARR